MEFECGHTACSCHITTVGRWTQEEFDILVNANALAAHHASGNTGRKKRNSSIISKKKEQFQKDLPADPAWMEKYLVSGQD
jgi:hypothetical protein